MNFYKDVMPKIYGIGASIVILGAMFKLLNWPGGALMLGVGLTTEAIIFFLSSFEPHEPEFDWSRIYPELSANYQGEMPVHARSHSGEGLGVKIDELLQQAQIDKELVERLGQGMQRLSDSMSNLNSIADLTGATERYVANVEKASESFEDIHKAQDSAISAIQGLSNISHENQAYQEQIQNITETLGTLNKSYQRELAETDLRSKTTYEVYMRMAESMDRMQAASDGTEKFSGELAQLSEKLSALNSIYGNMLSALKN